MLCWYIFITLSRVLSVGVQWGLNECLTTSNGKREKRKRKSPAQRKLDCSSPFSHFPLFFLSHLRKKDKFRVLIIPVRLRGWTRGCGVSGLSSRSCERQRLSTWLDKLSCQVGWMVSWRGESQWHCSLTSVHPRSIYMCCTEHTHTKIDIHTHTHTLCEAL